MLRELRSEIRSAVRMVRGVVLAVGGIAGVVAALVVTMESVPGFRSSVQAALVSILFAGAVVLFLYFYFNEDWLFGR